MAWHPIVDACPPRLPPGGDGSGRHDLRLFPKMDPAGFRDAAFAAQHVRGLSSRFLSCPCRLYSGPRALGRGPPLHADPEGEGRDALKIVVDFARVMETGQPSLARRDAHDVPHTWRLRFAKAAWRPAPEYVWMGGEREGCGQCPLAMTDVAEYDSRRLRFACVAALGKQHGKKHAGPDRRSAMTAWHGICCLPRAICTRSAE